MVGGFASEQDGELIKCGIFRAQTSENISCIKVAVCFPNLSVGCTELLFKSLDFDGGASAAGCVVRERCGTDKRGVGA